MSGAKQSILLQNYSREKKSLSKNLKQSKQLKVGSGSDGYIICDSCRDEIKYYEHCLKI